MPWNFKKQAYEESEPEVQSSQGVRASGLQVPGLPQPGKTTQGLSVRRRSSEPRKSFGTVRNFWRQLEGGGPEPKRVRKQFGKRPSEEKLGRKSLKKPVLRRLVPTRQASRRLPTIQEEPRRSSKSASQSAEAREVLRPASHISTRQTNRPPDEAVLIQVHPPSDDEIEGHETEATDVTEGASEKEEGLDISEGDWEEEIPARTSGEKHIDEGPSRANIGKTTIRAPSGTDQTNLLAVGTGEERRSSGRKQSLEGKQREIMQPESVVPQEEEGTSGRIGSLPPQYEERRSRQIESLTPQYEERRSRQMESLTPQYEERRSRQMESLTPQYEERRSRQMESLTPQYEERRSRQMESLIPQHEERRSRHSIDKRTSVTQGQQSELRTSKQSREWRDSMFGGLLIHEDEDSVSVDDGREEGRTASGVKLEEELPLRGSRVTSKEERPSRMGVEKTSTRAHSGLKATSVRPERTSGVEGHELLGIQQSVRRSSARVSQQGSVVPPPPPPPLPPPLPPTTFLKPPSLWHIPKLGLATRRPSILLPLLLEEEKHFHELVASGDVMAVQDFLERRPNFNINCTNYQGISALLIAVKSDNEEMVQFLIAQPNLEIGDTHLYAIRDDKPLILRMILDTLQSINPSLEFMACANSAEFAENVTPLILAAQCGHYEIIGILLARGHTIPIPHPPRCFCKEECQVLLLTEDPLAIASGKLHIYRAICNPAYICQTSDDPILAAFQLSKELITCGHVEQTYMRQYEDLAEATRLFALDLIAECRTSEEVKIIISEARGTDLKGLYTFPRLILAMDLKQKEFVAHPNIQQVLEKTWHGDWVAWKGYRKPMKAVYFIPRIFMLPGILVILMFMPTSSWAKFYALPINKLLSTIASYSIFLILVFVQSNVDKTNQTRDTKPTGVEMFIAIYVVAFLYDSIRTLLIEGPRRFFCFMWNVYEVTMEVLFILTFIFWITAAIKTTVSGTKDVERKYWNYMDSELIAEGLFVIASIMAYLKILLICQMSYDLGPLQVSLGKMTNDCAIFSVILGIIIFAFTIGLCKFYNYYDGMQQKNPDSGEVDEKQASSFTSFLETFKTLFWGLFGMSSYEVADVVIENLKDEKGDPVLNEHHFTEAIGYIVFAVYMTLTVIVILNMLIATMSNTFQKVTDNVDTEWAFGRTEVKLAYMNKPVLPPPFNIIPTTRGLVDLCKGAKDKAVRITGLVDAEKGLMEEEKKAEEFSIMMSQLVQRYFSTKSNAVT